MKRTIFALSTMLVVFVAVFAVLTLRPLPKVKAGNHGCSLSTLNGNYGLVGSGFYNAGSTLSPNWLPATLTMIVTFNGTAAVGGDELYTMVSGHISHNDITVSGGVLTMNSDCSFNVTFPSGLFDASEVILYGSAVDTGGDQVTGQLSASSLNVTGTFDAKRVATGKWNFFE